MNESVQDKIFKIVFCNSKISQNEIWRRAKNIHGKATFEKNLSVMQRHGILITEKDPKHSQKKLFSVNPKKSTTLSNLDWYLDKMDEIFEKNQLIVYNFLEKYYLSNNPRVRKGLIDSFSILVDDILKISRIEFTYNLIGNPMIHQKIKTIHKKHIETFKKSLKLLRKKNPNVFKDMIAFTVYKLEIPI